MSLDIRLTAPRPTDIYSANITHNLGRMAREAGIYDCLWRPEENGITHAGQLVGHIQNGLALMRADPDRFRALDAPNGWGRYDDFIPWLERLLAECQANPDAEGWVSR